MRHVLPPSRLYCALPPQPMNRRKAFAGAGCAKRTIRSVLRWSRCLVNDLVCPAGTPGIMVSGAAGFMLMLSQCQVLGGQLASPVLFLTTWPFHGGDGSA